MNGKPIIYYDWQRHYYAVLDFVQTTWSRFSSSRTGRFTLWFTKWFFKVLVKVLVWGSLAVIIVGCGVLYASLSFALGQGKVAKSISKANG